jgi:hypothetical protein
VTATAESFPQPNLSERRERLNLLRSVFGANKLMLLGAFLTAVFVVVGIVGLVILAVRDFNPLWTQHSLS